jgi:hypothetical protein
MISSLLFGDIFRYEQKEYIFLAKSERIIYAAEILNSEISEKINNLFQGRLAKGKDSVLETNILYCYVLLQTEEYRNRCASFAHSGKDDFGITFQKLSIVLSSVDLKFIKKEIMEKRAIPKELKLLIANIDI